MRRHALRLTGSSCKPARVLATRPLPATIDFVWFTSEEAGLLGSREFARRAVTEGKNVAGALKNDIVGYANDGLDDTIRYSSATVRDIQHGAALLFTDLTVYAPMDMDTGRPCGIIERETLGIAK